MLKPGTSASQTRSPFLHLLLLVSFIAACSSVDQQFGSGSSRDGNCSAVLELGSAYVKWRYDGPGIRPTEEAPYCVIQHFDKRLTERCMVRRFAASGGSKLTVWFIGDSRLREFFFRLSGHMAVTREKGRGKDNCLEWIDRRYAAGEQPHGRDHWCSYQREGDTAILTYLSRNLVDHRYLESVRQLLRQCRLQSRCPHLVLANGGIHELSHNTANHSVQGVQRFGKQMEQLAPMLQQLAKLGVTVLWVLNESVMEDAGGGLVRVPTELTWLMNQAALASLRRHGGPVRVWSSQLPVALWYYEICRYYEYPVSSEFRCDDMLHFGNFAYDNYMDIWLNYVCDKLVHMPESNCCGVQR